MSVRPHSADLAGSAQTAFVLLLVGFLVLDASHFGMGEAERLAYLLVVLGAVSALSVILRAAPPARPTWIVAVGWFLCLTLWLVPSITQTRVYHQYLAGDLVSLALPAMMLPLIMASPGLLSRGRTTLLGVGMFVAATLAPVLGMENSRYEPPSTMLIAGLWWLLVVAKAPAQRLFVVAMLVVIGVLIIGSGQRTALLIWIGCAGYALLQFFWSSRSWLQLLFAVVGLSLLLVVASMRVELSELVAGHRVESVASGRADDSLLARLEEAKDVLETMKAEGRSFNYVWGFGHGATYEPRASFLSRNVTPDGRVHNIHIGPLMILFRYGLAGLAFYALLVVSVVRTLCVRVRDATTVRQVQSGLGLVCAGFLTEGLMFNVLVDPLFAIALAGLVSTFGLERVDRRSGRTCDVLQRRSADPPLQGHGVP